VPKPKAHNPILSFSLKDRDLAKVRIEIAWNGFAAFYTLDETPNHPMRRKGYDVWLYQGSEFLCPAKAA